MDCCLCCFGHLKTEVWWGWEEGGTEIIEDKKESDLTVCPRLLTNFVCIVKLFVGTWIFLLTYHFLECFPFPPFLMVAQRALIFIPYDSSPLPQLIGPAVDCQPKPDQFQIGIWHESQFRLFWYQSLYYVKPRSYWQTFSATCFGKKEWFCNMTKEISRYTGKKMHREKEKRFLFMILAFVLNGFWDWIALILVFPEIFQHPFNELLFVV